MKFADRACDTTTTTGTGDISLSGVAPDGYQSLAAIPVGDDFDYCIRARTGAEWEIGTGKRTGPTTLQRVTVLSGSNGTSKVNFSAGAKDVFCTVSAQRLGKFAAADADILAVADASANVLVEQGGVFRRVPKSQFAGGSESAPSLDPADVGYDIIILAGQSNMCGRGTSDAEIDVADPRIMQWNGPSTKIMIGCDPLYHGEGPSTGKVGPGPYIARAYLSQVPPNRRVLLVPCGVGGSGLAGGSMTWQAGNPGGNGYENTITKANAALAAAQAHLPNSRVVGIAWHQGETDADYNITQADHVAALKATIAGFRSRITGASNAWVVIGQMCPEVIAASSNLVKYTAIDNAHKQVAAEISRAAYAAGPTGQKLDSWHYTAEGSRRLGYAMGMAVRQAISAAGSDVTAPTFVSGQVTNSVPTVVRVGMSESLAAVVPAASAFTLSGGRTVTNVAVSGNEVLLTASPAYAYGDAITVTYAKPGANQLQDAAGNQVASFGPSAITNNVQQADSTAPTVSSAQVASNSPSVIAITMSESLASVTPAASAFAATGRTVTGVAVAGAVVSVTVGPPYTSNDAITVTYTKPGANMLQDTAGNQAASFGPLNVTNNVPASQPAVVAPGAPTIGTAVAGDGYVDVAFTAPENNGGDANLTYTAALSTGETNSGTASPIRVTASNGVARTATVTAANSAGSGPASAASNSVTPQAAAQATYATWNPSDTAAGITLSNGNRTATGTTGWKSTRANMGRNSGKLYWEVTVGSTALIAGVGLATASLTAFAGSNSQSWGYYSTGQRYFNNSGVGMTNGAYVAGDVLGFALDLDAKTLQYYKNGAAIGTPITLRNGTATDSPVLTTELVYPMLSTNNSSATANFGATAFAYAPPTDFVGLAA